MAFRHDFINIKLGSQSTFLKYLLIPYTDDLICWNTSGRVFKITDASTASFLTEDISGSNTSGYISSIDIGESDNKF